MDECDLQGTKFVLEKPSVIIASDGNSIKQPPKSENYTEKTTMSDGSVKIDCYVNDPHGTFVPLFHMFVACKKSDKVNIFLNSGLFSDDAELILSCMDICKAPITVYVGLISGFYAACIVAAADVRKYTEMSAISLSSPKEFLTLRGLANLEQQITYIQNSTQQYINVLIDRGFCTKEEIDDIISKNKSILFKREDLARRLDNTSSSNNSF